METEALSDLEGQVSLFPGGCSLGIHPSPAGLSYSGLMLTGGSWRCFLKVTWCLCPQCSSNREVIQGVMCISQELTPWVASLAGRYWLPVSVSSVALWNCKLAVVPLGTWELCVCNFQVYTRSWCPAGGDSEVVGCWGNQWARYQGSLNQCQFAPICNLGWEIKLQYAWWWGALPWDMRSWCLTLSLQWTRCHPLLWTSWRRKRSQRVGSPRKPYPSLTHSRDCSMRSHGSAAMTGKKAPCLVFLPLSVKLS